jgi:hypothetical protein
MLRALIFALAAAQQKGPEDGGAQLLRSTRDWAQRTDALAHEAALSSSVPQVAASAGRSAESAAATEATAAGVAGLDLSPILASAQAELDKANEKLAAVKATADKAEEDARAAAKAAAEAAVAKVKAEAAAYFQAKLDHLASLATVPVNPKVANAQKLAQPYMAAALQTQGLVFQYNQKASDMISGAYGKVGLAKRLSAQANQEQAAGDVVMANRHMIQAHGLMVTAQMDEDQAKSIYALAREFNQVIPMYQAAGRQAAEAALAFNQVRGRRQLLAGPNSTGEARKPPRLRRASSGPEKPPPAVQPAAPAASPPAARQAARPAVHSSTGVFSKVPTAESQPAAQPAAQPHEARSRRLRG